MTQDPVDRNHHQSRSANHSFWTLIQSVNWDGHSIAIRDIEKLHKNPYKLGKQFLGMGMTLAAFEDCPADNIETISTIAHATLEEELRSLYENNHKEFVKRMKRKKNDCLPAFLFPEREKDDDGNFPF